MGMQVRVQLADVFPQSGWVLFNGHRMETSDGQALDREAWAANIEVSVAQGSAPGLFFITSPAGTTRLFRSHSIWGDLLNHGGVAKLGDRAWSREIDSVECTCAVAHVVHEVVMAGGVFTVPSTWVQSDIVEMWVPNPHNPEGSDRRLHNLITGEHTLLP